jgi:hypothetical protein
MITSMAQADKEMADLFRQSWEVGAGFKCDWPNHKTEEHAEDETWARWALDYFGGRQVTMAKKTQRKFNRQGLIFVTVFTPLGGGLASARSAAEIAINTYEGERTPGDVWFRNVRIESEGHGQGSGRNKSWWTTEVVAEFIYEQLR